MSVTEESHSRPSKRSGRSRGGGKRNGGLPAFDRDLIAAKSEGKELRIWFGCESPFGEKVFDPISCQIVEVDRYFIKVMLLHTGLTAGSVFWISKAAILAVGE